jgi:hypothetical protein
MTMRGLVETNLITKQFLKRFSAGLKGVDRTTKDEIRAEITSHITDRAAQFQQMGSVHPVEDALSAFGEPEALSSLFVEEMRWTTARKEPSSATRLRHDRRHSA